MEKGKSGKQKIFITEGKNMKMKYTEKAINIKGLLVT